MEIRKVVVVVEEALLAPDGEEGRPVVEDEAEGVVRVDPEESLRMDPAPHDLELAAAAGPAPPATAADRPAASWTCTIRHGTAP